MAFVVRWRVRLADRSMGTIPTFPKNRASRSPIAGAPPACIGLALCCPCLEPSPSACVLCAETPLRRGHDGRARPCRECDNISLLIPRGHDRRMSTTRLRLMAFGPAWGAPSLDAACTKADVWMRFCRLREGVDFAVDSSVPPYVGMGGHLPVLQVDGGAGGQPRIAEPDEIFTALSELGHNLDKNLTPEQRAESLAFTALIEERLQVAMLFSWWEDEANYDAVVRPALVGTLPVPLCFYLPWTLRRRVHSQLARRRCLGEGVAYGMGEAALEALSVRLKERPFFHGNEPTGVDASAFAYLTAVLRCPLPHDRLRVALRKHPNLVHYCERIAAQYFAPPPPLLPAVEVPEPRRLSMDSRAHAEAAEAAAATGSSGGASGSAESASKGKKEPRTAKQQRFRRRSRNAVVGAVGAAVMYALAVDTFSTGGDAESEEEDAK